MLDIFLPIGVHCPESEVLGMIRELLDAYSERKHMNDKRYSSEGELDPQAVSEGELDPQTLSEGELDPQATCVC